MTNLHGRQHGDVERALLESFAEDAAPRPAKAAVLSALGFNGALVASQTAAVASPAARVGVLLLTKWIGVGAMTGGLIVGALQAFAPRPESVVAIDSTIVPKKEEPSAKRMDHGSPEMKLDERGPAGAPSADGRAPSESASIGTVPALRAARPRTATSHSLPESVSVPRSPESPSAAPALGPPVLQGVGTAAFAESSSLSEAKPAAPATTLGTMLAAEVTELESVRQALATGAPATALSRLAHYDKEFPAGALRPEATVLRVEAWMKSGAPARAAEIAEASLPALPPRYAEKVRLLLSPENK